MSRVRLFVGTRRGLFAITSDAQRRNWQISEPMLVGREIYFVGVDHRDGTIRATSTHKVWGPHIHVSRDHGETWDLLENAPHFDDERGLTAVWSIAPGPDAEPDTLFAGIEPAGLFVTHDAGATWQEVESLNRHDTSDTWQQAGGALALHSVQLAKDQRTLYCAVSAGGSYRSDDLGKSWHAINDNVRADFLPQRYPQAGQCVHRQIIHPLDAQIAWQQNHCGVYRTTDGGEHWAEITSDLPSEYGYALAIDPHDPHTAFVIPEESSHMRTTIGGRIAVYRTTDGGASWHALTNGLPQQNAYISILREGMVNDTLDPVGVYFGTSSGHVFASPDRGETWLRVAEFLPRVLALGVAVV